MEAQEMKRESPSLSDATDVSGAVSGDGSGYLPRTPLYNDQRTIITPLLRPSLKIGDAFYLLDVKWFDLWQKYVGFDKYSVVSAGSEANKPGPMDLSGLYYSCSPEKLKENMLDELDYYLVPEVVWEKFLSWYGLVDGQSPIRRRVVEQGMFVKHCRVEVYLVTLKLILHGKDEEVVVKSFSRADTVQDLLDAMKEAFDIDSETACRVWNRYITSRPELISKMTDVLGDSGLYDEQMVVVEPRNADGTWPMGDNSMDIMTSSSSLSYSLGSSATTRSSLASSRSDDKDNGAATSTTTSAAESSSSSSSKGLFGRNFWPMSSSSSIPTATPGLCGLSNLGNTCFMNSALQCLSNTPELTRYFLERRHQKELNRDNPLGMRGMIATAYGDLLEEMWGGRTSVTAPRLFKSNVGKFAPQFSGFAQHDSQELLSFLMDGLHEDLNRIKKKPYVEMKESDGRTDAVVAKEAWENHLKRNDSIIVDTFQGQFKSRLECPECKLVSVTFDPFMFLQVPLPVEHKRKFTVIVVTKDLSAPPKMVSVTAPKSGSIGDLLVAVAKVCDLAVERLVLADVYNFRFHKVFKNSSSLTSVLDRDNIVAYELGCAVSETSISGKMALLFLYNRKQRKSYTGSFLSSSTEKSVSRDLFAHPQMMCVPRESTKTYAALHSAIVNHLRPLVPASLSQAPTGTLLALAKDATISTTTTNNEDEDTDGNKMDTDMDDNKMDEVVSGENGEKVMESVTSEEPDAKSPQFGLCFINAYGSSEIGELTPASAVKLACDNYLGLNWQPEMVPQLDGVPKVIQHSSCDSSTKAAAKLIDLEDCLRLFLTEEQLGVKDPWYCPRCKEHRRAFKKFDLWRMPKVLVIQLKRFSYNSYWRDKIDAMVRFPVESLDLSEHCMADGPGGCKKVIYDLHAVSNHYGGMGGGHYTAYARNKDSGSWYHFDDSSVKPVSSDVIQSRAAYVLCYTRRDGDAPPSCEEAQSTSV